MNRLDEHGTTILWLERWLFRDQWWLIRGESPERQGVVMGAGQAGAHKKEGQARGAFMPPWERWAFKRVFG